MTDADPDERGALDHLAEVLVFAPLGLALEARHLWPELVDRGRGQVKLARATGRRALLRHRRWIGDQVTRVQREAEAAGRGLGLVPASDEPAPAATAAEAVDPSTPADAPAPSRTVSDVPVAELAIPDYDSLSASQVVPRLAGLSRDELELVWRYESAGRGRRTILNKIAQLRES